MNMRVLFQDNGQTLKETVAITFGILTRNTQEQWSMGKWGKHDLQFIIIHGNILYSWWI